MSHYFIVIAWSLAAVAAAKSKDRRPPEEKECLDEGSHTTHYGYSVRPFSAASDDSFHAGYTIGAGSSSKTAMMAPVQSKEAASKLGMYLLKFLKNILILNYPHNWVWC